MTDESAATYDPSQYERPSVTVDVVIFAYIDDQLQVLLVRRKHWPFENMWALPGGFVQTDESLEAAAARELAEETGVQGVSPQQLYTFGDPDRDPRMRVITVAYFALLSADAREEPQADSDAAETRWFPVKSPPELAFDHAQILDCALERLQDR